MRKRTEIACFFSVFLCFFLIPAPASFCNLSASPPPKLALKPKSAILLSFIAAAAMGISVFISTVSDEFRFYRDQLKDDLERHNVHVKTQENFKDLGDATLDKLDEYIRHCDAVVHLVGEMCGSAPGEREQAALLRNYPDLPNDLPPLAVALAAQAPITYTQWEAWLALYHKKLLLIAEAGATAPRDE